MDNTKKTLKSPLSAKNTINPLHCEECKARIAGEAQKILAKEVLSRIEFIETHIGASILYEELVWLKDLLKQIIG